jgi:hemerythrin-like domain-containing protein
MNINQYLSADHKHCDEEFASMENYINEGDFTQGKAYFAKFANDLLHHFEMEESVMFPVFENRSGTNGGPTTMMKHEHAQMRKLIEDLKKALDKNNKDDFLGSSDTLMFLMQQHNMKEEQMLYQLADNTLGGDSALVVSQMQDLAKSDKY